MTIADDVVALRSFPRRYREKVAGVRDDDAWDRLVRTVPPGHHRSALGWVVHTTALADALAEAAAALPRQSRPRLDLARLEAAASEPPVEATVDEVLDALAEACTRAAAEVDARSSAEWDRTIAVDGVDRRADDAVDRVVQAAARHLRDADAAVEAARAAR